jgi:hypothetical protein
VNNKYFNVALPYHFGVIAAIDLILDATIQELPNIVRCVNKNPMIQVNCTYKDEQYSVRDSGEVLRHPCFGKQPRTLDNKWTFGKPNDKTGYMEIATARVHRIVATAFHGPAPTKEHVVDHIDTNKRNNRPENLRWVTKLENVLLNPITIKRIEFVCGCNVEEFLADPSKFRDKFQEPNYKWMCAVNAQEAQISLERLLAWAKSDKIPTGGTLGEWVFNRGTSQSQFVETNPEEHVIVKTKTLNATQRNWNTPSEFPCCPIEFTGEPITAYAEKLKTGLVFCRNDIYSSLVSKSAISHDHQSLYVISESKKGIKPWALAEISYENGLFVHTSLGTFFEQNGVEKQFCFAQGLEWSGGDSIDDFC